MANPEHVAIVKQGDRAIREWRESDARRSASLILDLSEAYLGFERLSEADLSDAILTVSGAALEAARFSRTDLNGADMTGASRGQTEFACIDLS